VFRGPAAHGVRGTRVVRAAASEPTASEPTAPAAASFAAASSAPSVASASAPSVASASAFVVSPPGHCYTREWERLGHEPTVRLQPCSGRSWELAEQQNEIRVRAQSHPRRVPQHD